MHGNRGLHAVRTDETVVQSPEPESFGQHRHPFMAELSRPDQRFSGKPVIDGARQSNGLRNAVHDADSSINSRMQRHRHIDFVPLQASDKLTRSSGDDVDLDVRMVVHER
ncbi:hypothetical protein GCM10009611_25630 [Arthrobacter roseus]